MIYKGQFTRLRALHHSNGGWHEYLRCEDKGSWTSTRRVIRDFIFLHFFPACVDSALPTTTIDVNMHSVCPFLQKSDASGSSLLKVQAYWIVASCRMPINNTRYNNLFYDSARRQTSPDRQPQCSSSFHSAKLSSMKIACLRMSMKHAKCEGAVKKV